MTAPTAPDSPEPEGGVPSVAARLALYQRAGGIVTPFLTALFAFLAAGLVVLATTNEQGHHNNPLRVYKAIFEGTGLSWFFQFEVHGSFPFLWEADPAKSLAAFSLQQTLLLVTPLMLTGLAVAFAFRCGLFNIGGLGQYLVGAMLGMWVGSSFADMQPAAHIALAIGVGSLGGAAWAGIAGLLKATVGAHEVITTIMLNWIAYWVAIYLVGQRGPLQNSRDVAVPVSNDVVEGAKLPVWWGERVLQGTHIGFFIALTALMVYWLVLNRSTLGFEVKAVGFNPEAARYGGISVARNYFLAMAISGSFAGMAGAIDILGWQFRIGAIDVQNLTLPFLGIAVALLGRNTAIGVGLSALLFGSLLNGTSTRSLDPATFPPELAGNLTLIIQALVLLFVGADLIILYLWQLRRRVRLRTAAART
jgi:general nucleoside transport system permease protein